jgi:hypothetical protein
LTNIEGKPHLLDGIEMRNIKNLDKFVTIPVPDLCLKGSCHIDILRAGQGCRGNFHSLGQGGITQSFSDLG